MSPRFLTLRNFPRYQVLLVLVFVARLSIRLTSFFSYFYFSAWGMGLVAALLSMSYSGSCQETMRVGSWPCHFSTSACSWDDSFRSVACPNQQAACRASRVGSLSSWIASSTQRFNRHLVRSALPRQDQMPAQSLSWRWIAGPCHRL